MHPEKEIVNLWLNRKGFFTISNIKAANNREVDLLAINQKKKEILHVEIVSSITSIDTLSEKEIIERFENKSVLFSQ